MDEKLVDEEQSYWWLEYRDIKVQIEITIVVDHNQAIQYKMLAGNIFKEENENKSLLLTTQYQDVPFWKRMKE